MFSQVWSKVLVITENQDLASRLEEELHAAALCVCHAATFLEGLSHLVSEDIDLTIIQLSSPWEKSIHTLYPIRWVSDTALIVMLYPGQEADKAHFLDLADDCIWLPLPDNKMPFMIRNATRRRLSMLASHGRRPFFYCRGLLVFPEQRRVFYGDGEVKPTRTEYEILNFLIKNRDSIVSRFQIMDGVWNHRYYNESEKTVNVHIHALRRKLALRTEEVFIETIRGFGYRFVTAYDFQQLSMQI